MPVGDMFIVLGHETKTRYDAKMQAVTTRTEYFVPYATNTREEAADFVKEVKGSYHADIVQTWNPRRERTCQMSNDDWADSFGEYKHLYECGICSESTALLCCINENGDTDWVKPKFCGHCGAKVVGE